MNGLWPIDRCGEAIDAIARVSRWLDAAGRESLLYDGAPIDRWVPMCAAFKHVEAEPVLIKYASIDHSLHSLGPSLILVDGGLLAVISTTLRDAIVIIPEGGRMRIRLRSIAAKLGAAVEMRHGPEADRALEAVGSRLPRGARAAMIQEFAAEAVVGGIWILRAPIQTVSPNLREGRIVPRILAFAASQIVLTLLLMLSWFVLGMIALGSGGERGLFVLWLLIALTTLPIRFLGTSAGRLAAAETGSLLKRRLLAGALKLEPDEVHGQGVGAFMAHVLESGSVENLGSHGATMSLTAIAMAAGTLLALSFGAGGLPHATLFLFWIVLSAVLTTRYYFARSLWTEARFAVTSKSIEHLAGHTTRLVQQPADERCDHEDALLNEYVQAEEQLNRSALILDFVCKAWPWVGLAGLGTQLVAGDYSRSSMAVSAGGILLGSLSLAMWTDSIALISGAAIAWRRLSRFWRTAARTSTRGSRSSLPILDKPAARGIPLLELSSVTFRHANRERATLSDVTLAIGEGDRVLLDGRSGSGKSTLALLMSGGRPLQSGLLLFRGLDISTVGVESWRRRVMLAPQFHTNEIFSASLGYNLLLGRAWPPAAEDLEAAENVCREVGLADLVEKMPLGLDQTVGETGWQLSHGERTRVFLARVLLQEPALMILDETFGALDPETLTLAMASVLRRPSALVVVAHT